ncbi:heterokaryon incompatibility protein-domain-containing protein [Cadophora sp. MPI-SDFR-AT-0126]|nr:heterokaryon incompatibility protein-domain-containing protein [Leotiomycetes sp. MPI-SDFR-AT-0126]
MNTCKGFVYKSFAAANNEIRLLRLRAGGAGDAIAATLDHYPFHEAVPYYALSYTWGNTADVSYILLNGWEVPVTANLEGALRALRKLEEDCCFWIDALCINQHDIQERNSEVPRMREIYERADLVVAWLGQGNARSDRVIDFINSNKEAILVRAEIVMTEEAKTRIWRVMIEELLMRPWWQRVWVIQEIAVAKDVKIFCGYKSLLWGQLGDGIKIAIENHGKNHGEDSLQGDIYSALNRAVELRNIRTRRIRLAPTILNWKELILRARASLATQKVDKIYGLLGLATQSQLPGLHVDYDAPVQEVFKQFTSLLCTKEQRLDLICLANRTHSIPGLPSWTPNLSAVFGIKPLNKMRLEARYRAQFDANGTADEVGRLREDPNTHFKFSETLNTLYADGLVIDFIETLATPGSGYEHCWDDIGLDCRNRALAIYPDVAEPQAQYILGGLKYNAFLQTLGADVTATKPGYHPESGAPRPRSKPDVSMERMSEPDPIQISRANYNRRFMVSHEGYMGLVPKDAEAKDLICILFGCDTPVVIREIKHHHLFIGERYFKLQDAINSLICRNLVANT